MTTNLVTQTKKPDRMAFRPTNEDFTRLRQIASRMASAGIRETTHTEVIRFALKVASAVKQPKMKEAV